MPRYNSIEKLPLDQQVVIEKIIHEHRYQVLDNMIADIRAQGISHISRSALGRYALKLKARNRFQTTPEEDTIVTIVERTTGAVHVVKTWLAAELVAEKIRKIQAPTVVS